MFAITLPPKVQEIVQALEKSGFEAFVVGGCVRDCLLQAYFTHFTSLRPKDWDIATSATPIEATQVLRSMGFQVVPTGLRYGTISVIDHPASYEITTYRTDGDYQDCRKPKEVKFVRRLDMDLSRRDFTINAMAYNPVLGLIDPFLGREDLRKGLIRAVGNANKRFTEDALRILRALRFASRLGFQIAPPTHQAIFACQHLLKFVSKERITQEFKGIICGEFAYQVCKEYAPILAFILGIDLRDSQSLAVLARSPNDFFVRILALISTQSHHTQALSQICAHLRLDKKSQKCITQLVAHISLEFCPQDKWLKQHLALLGQEGLEILLALKIAQASAFGLDDTKERLVQIAQKIQDILLAQEPFRLQDLCINGNDLKKLGIKEGKGIKTMLEYALNLVMDKKVPNSREALMACIKNFIQSN
ncbi:hypothetical protein BKH46_03570 [Helicobacter sp. 12S02634-8]|uniref:CCA tRNA nucleotidyltransferase n=1 Tax=Helicobacter sp. 12S02634-8 TaxID=1476199 RepID=UPI000BA779B1|nr:hypothetical protein [Helicobacter sp. 12S02634-8]PAF47518.1 hypothetical protein BKH46_03570 [Helicobacter sp. 12S02634-8]